MDTPAVIRIDESLNALRRVAVDSIFAVHKTIGPGLLESVYEQCLSYELRLRGIEHVNQAALPVVYKGATLDAHFFMDIVLPGKLVIELKTVEKLLPIHEAQLLTYMKLSKIGLGLLLNFNSAVLKDGIRRIVL